MVLYIHGFASSGRGSKAWTVRQHFGAYAMAPSLSYVPELAFDTLTQLVERFLPHEPIHLIGSSLGGFYAANLAERYGLKAVLINPSLKPYETLAAYTGEVKNFYDLSAFEWNERHIQTLESLALGPIKTPGNYMVLLQTGDELLDWHVAAEMFQDGHIFIEEGGSHAFEGFENHLAAIEKFFS